MKRLPPRPDLYKRTYVMGVLNITPDSFSDGGRYVDMRSAVKHALEMVKDGADIIDVGGESSRPGSRGISVDEELVRVIPVIRMLVGKTDAAISIDTTKAKVAAEALKAGAGIVNDISGLKHDKLMAAVVAKAKAGLIIMHMRGTPEDMQSRARYHDVVKEIIADLKDSIHLARAARVSRDKIIIDPGIGFGKTLKHNLEILNRLDEFKVLQLPIAIGTSRKSFIGLALGIKEPHERLTGTIATCVAAIMRGANIIRIHDVKEGVHAARMTDAILRQGAS